MNTVTEILTHLTQRCVRCDDGSLVLGKYEVELLERALDLSIPFRNKRVPFSICEEDANHSDTKGQCGSGSHEDDF